MMSAVSVALWRVRTERCAVEYAAFNEVLRKLLTSYARHELDFLFMSSEHLLIPATNLLWCHLAPLSTGPDISCDARAHDLRPSLVILILSLRLVQQFQEFYLSKALSLRRLTVDAKLLVSSIVTIDLPNSTCLDLGNHLPEDDLCWICPNRCSGTAESASCILYRSSPLKSVIITSSIKWSVVSPAGTISDAFTSTTNDLRSVSRSEDDHTSLDV